MFCNTRFCSGVCSPVFIDEVTVAVTVRCLWCVYVGFALRVRRMRMRLRPFVFACSALMFQCAFSSDGDDDNAFNLFACATIHESGARWVCEAVPRQCSVAWWSHGEIDMYHGELSKQVNEYSYWNIIKDEDDSRVKYVNIEMCVGIFSYSKM